VKRRRHTSWATRTDHIAKALDAARGVETAEAALVAGDALSGLIESLRDDQVDEKRQLPEVTAALTELAAALQRVNKLRLSQREFVDASVDELVEELGQKDALALFDRKYRGRYVRWKVKFKGKGEDGGFIVNVGAHVEGACALDPCVPRGTLERLEPWQVTTIEGRFSSLESFGNASDPRRARVVFDHCIVG